MIKSIANSLDFKKSFNSNVKLIQVGLNKIFMKDEVKIYLECKLTQTYMKYIMLIQSSQRMLRAKLKLKKKKKLSLVIQRRFKGFALRKRFKSFKNKLNLKQHFKAQAKKLILPKLNDAKIKFKAYLDDIKRKKEQEFKKSLEDKLKSQQLNVDFGSVEKSNKMKSDEKLIQIKGKKVCENNKSFVNEDMKKDNSFVLPNDFSALMNKINLKKKKANIVDQLITSKDQILDKEYKEKIDLLTIENNSLKQELELANSKVKEKEIENNKLKTKLNIFEKSGDESLKKST